MYTNRYTETRPTEPQHTHTHTRAHEAREGSVLGFKVGSK